MLIYSLIFVQVFPNLVRADEKNKKVALIGIKFVNVPQQTKDIISSRMAAILELHASFFLTKPDQAKIVYGRNEMDELLTKKKLNYINSLQNSLGLSMFSRENWRTKARTAVEYSWDLTLQRVN